MLMLEPLGTLTIAPLGTFPFPLARNRPRCDAPDQIRTGIAARLWAGDDQPEGRSAWRNRRVAMTVDAASGRETMVPLELGRRSGVAIRPPGGELSSAAEA